MLYDLSNITAAERDRLNGLLGDIEQAIEDAPPVPRKDLRRRFDAFSASVDRQESRTDEPDVETSTQGFGDNLDAIRDTLTDTAAREACVEVACLLSRVDERARMNEENRYAGPDGHEQLAVELAER